MAFKVINKKSNQTQSGAAKLPSAGDLEYGELAINYHDGVEKIYIKNDNGDIVEFVPKEQITSITTTKADKVSSATNNNFAALNSNGNLKDSGYKASDFATALQMQSVQEDIETLSNGPHYDEGSRGVIFPVTSSASYNATSRSVTFPTLNV